MPNALSIRAARPLAVCLAAAVLLSLAPTATRADDTPFVKLVGRAVLPADTFAPGPPSGSAITGDTNGRAVPFASQPVQGFSAVLPKGNGNWLVMPDNGYGAKGNSADFRLRWYEVAPSFKTKSGGSGGVKVLGYTELSDPNRLVPFRIVNGDGDRVLTGADFDLESFRQVADGSFWFGEEFGPYLLHADAQGHLLEAPIPTPYPAVLAPFAKFLPAVQSPDNPAFAAITSADQRRANASLPSSKGFEGMALNTSGTRLYPLLEGPLVLDTVRTRLLMQEFDLASKKYTGNYWFYPMEDAGNAIGDMTAINDNQFLVIERDNGMGATAKFKRVYSIDLRTRADDGTVRKTLVADLMSIDDSDGITKPEEGALGLGPVFTFLFVTIEDVYPVSADTLLVINDNNYPFSSGRRPGKAPDDNEFILLKLPQKLDLAK